MGGKPGEEMTITYRNKAGAARPAIHAADFGAAAEMDKKAHGPGDAARLTVTAPGLNADPGAVDEIGRGPDSLVRMRAGHGSLEGHRLVEAGPDTGIFWGELRRVAGSPARGGGGPRDGEICGGEDDVLEVAVVAFGEEYTASAPIGPAGP